MNSKGQTTEGKDGWRNVRFEVLERIDKLPSLNSVIHEFLVLSKKDYYSAADFERVISKDQALVARLLRVANSALYGRSRTIRSIPEAVVLIGLDNLKRIVYAISTEGLTRRELVHYDFQSDGGFWLHSMAVGLAAQVFGAAAPGAGLRGEEAFVAGLMHDIGKLIIDDFLPGEDRAPVSLEQEREAVGLDHAELAEYLLKQWNLPPEITDAVRNHHGSPEDDACSAGGVLLGLAEGVCDQWGVGRKTPVDLSQEMPALPFLPAMTRIGLEEDRWESLVWDVRQQLADCENLYRLGA